MQKFSLLVLFTICILHPVNALERINELKWNSRIILVRALGETQDLLKMLRKFDYEIHDRDIYWFVFKEDNIETNFKGDIQENFHKDTLKKYFSDTKINVVLIGKDGGIKQQLNYLHLQSILDLIDTMPMRKMEMSESNLND